MSSNEFLDSLPEDPTVAALAMCKEFSVLNKNMPDGDRIASYPKFLEALAAFEAFCDAYRVPASGKISLDGTPKADINKITTFFAGRAVGIEQLIATSLITQTRERYRMRFGVTFAYEFTDGDLTRIQQLVNELRTELQQSELFTAEHKSRLMKRLEALQAEMHKKMSSLDRFWGLFGDAGIALGKFGMDAKPFTDRIREIAEIVWATQARAEELPSGTPLPRLGGRSDTE